MNYTKDEARTKIAELVAGFRANEARLNTQAEAQIENNFVRPLFEYLNWNTHNEGLAARDYEFVVQRTDRYGKRPDYVLQLDGQHLLVMDAKQVKYDMHDPRWLNQVYAYAYSTQNLSPVAQDRLRPPDRLSGVRGPGLHPATLPIPRSLSNFRVLDWRCDDYVTQFDTLWELFERENCARRRAHADSAAPPAYGRATSRPKRSRPTASRPTRPSWPTWTTTRPAGGCAWPRT